MSRTCWCSPQQMSSEVVAQGVGTKDLRPRHLSTTSNAPMNRNYVTLESSSCRSSLAQSDERARAGKISNISMTSQAQTSKATLLVTPSNLVRAKIQRAEGRPVWEGTLLGARVSVYWSTIPIRTTRDPKQQHRTAVQQQTEHCAAIISESKVLLQHTVEEERRKTSQISLKPQNNTKCCRNKHCSICTRIGQAVTHTR